MSHQTLTFAAFVNSARGEPGVAGAWLDRRLPRLHVEPAELASTGQLREPTGVGRPRER